MKLFFVFDLDGTLVDTLRVTELALDRMIATRGASPRQNNSLAKLISKGGLAIVENLAVEFGESPDELLLEFRDHLAKIQVPRSLIFPGIPDLLEKAIANGLGLAVNTNKPSALAYKTLIDTQLLGYFTYVQGSDNTLKKKPSLDQMRALCSHLKCQYSDMVFFGDSEVDQETAHKANMDYVHFQFGYGNLRSEFQQPRLTFSGLDAAAISEIIKTFCPTSA